MSATITPLHRPGSDGGVRAATLRGLLLARALDDARRAHGFTTRELASAMSMSPAMLNRVMTGRRTPTPLEIGGLCAVLDIPAPHRPVLYRLVRESGRTDWITTPADGEQHLAQIEAAAHSATWFAPDLIPRPLRTTAYSRAVLTATGAHPDTPAPATRDTAPTEVINRFLIHPRALRHPTVPEAVMREQVRHLREAHLSTTRLLPHTVAPYPEFRTLRIAHFPPVVHIEHHTTAVILERPDATAPHTAFLRDVEAVSLGREDTRQALSGRGDNG
ncbi:hypothetical protein UO65_4697 [Actinokineospora spheciospongiae]|uniref:HTH cro/C1-type domain-containing protein n=1 Tax=Actinokineospora spheciospongiae TaxID=909613 RepID=W7IHZ9_9PSEU|nr:Scr1 family TA system antitoxin-like transcriptional regulator [Actinokineospora spheciospongiae]EWC59988.1 hypothetical protein UO65_4697 [Actinokineospora spheciospongiae]